MAYNSSKILHIRQNRWDCGPFCAKDEVWDYRGLRANSVATGDRIDEISRRGGSFYVLLPPNARVLVGAQWSVHFWERKWVSGFPITKSRFRMLRIGNLLVESGLERGIRGSRMVATIVRRDATRTHIQECDEMLPEHMSLRHLCNKGPWTNPFAKTSVCLLLPPRVLLNSIERVSHFCRILQDELSPKFWLINSTLMVGANLDRRSVAVVWLMLTLATDAKWYSTEENWFKIELMYCFTTEAWLTAGLKTLGQKLGVKTWGRRAQIVFVSWK